MLGGFLTMPDVNPIRTVCSPTRAPIWPRLYSNSYRPSASVRVVEGDSPLTGWKTTSTVSRGCPSNVTCPVTGAICGPLLPQPATTEINNGAHKCDIRNLCLTTRHIL